MRHDYSGLMRRLAGAGRVTCPDGRTVGIEELMTESPAGRPEVGSDMPDHEGGPLSVGPKPGIGERIRAARLHAGILTYGEASQALGIPLATYRYAETGVRSASLKVIEAVSISFGVSIGFLLLAAMYVDADWKAARIAANVKVLEEREWSETRTVASRLMAARRNAGFRSGREASARFGWKLATYQAHEGGLRDMTVDRLIIYASAFGIDARQIAFDMTRPVRAAGFEPDITREHLPAVLEQMDEQLARWPWLVPVRTSSGGIELPVLHIVSGSLVLDPSRLTLPSGISGAMVGGGNDIFAIDPDGLGSSLLLLRRSVRDVGSEGYYAHDGRRVVELRPGGLALPGDPLQYRGSEAVPIELGRLVGRLKMDWSPD